MIKISSYLRSKRFLGSFKELEEKDNWLSPSHLIKIGADKRFGQCKSKAVEWVRRNNGELFVMGNQHAIGYKDGIVYDYVLFPGKLVPGREYFKHINRVFELKVVGNE